MLADVDPGSTWRFRRPPRPDWLRTPRKSYSPILAYHFSGFGLDPMRRARAA
jgi:hypothetical protein